MAAVEFALVAGLLFTLLIGIMEFGRVLYYWNSAAEATRLGARLAVVCDPGDGENIKTKMQAIFPALPTDNIQISYSPSADVNLCKFVTVSVSDWTVTTVIPFVPLSLPVPSFSTTLPRESMNSTDNSVCN